MCLINTVYKTNQKKIVMENQINIRVLQHENEDIIRIGMAVPIFDLGKTVR